MKFHFTILFSLLAISSATSAQIFKCTDPSTGKMTFTDVPCQNLGSSQVAGGNKSIATQNDLSTAEMTKRIADAKNAAHKAMIEHATKKAMRTASPNEDPRFAPQIRDNSWHFKFQKACAEEQNATQRQGLDKDNLIKCTYQRVEIHINQLAELSGDPDISRILTSSIYPTIERKPDQPTLSTETVLLKKGKEGINQAIEQGLLTAATQADVQKWQEKSGVGTLPPMLTHLEKYNVKGKLNLAGGLTGAHAVAFLVPNALLMPSGDRGHSIILILDSGACVGHLCSMIK